MVAQDGLEWVNESIWGLEPRWTREPDISKVESIARKHLKLDPSSSCTVKFYAEGIFNKLYKVETEAESSLMRVTLPVDPFHKTNSEVATIQFVRENTTIPVPEIFAFDDSAENELGFEWILMEMLPGVELRQRWRKLSMVAKQDLVKQIAEYQSQLFCHKFSAIGNLFVPPSHEFVVQGPSTAQENEGERGDSLAPTKKSPATQGTSISPEAGISDPAPELEKLRITTTTSPSTTYLQTLPNLGQIVSIIFFQGDNITQTVPRGPFARSEDWIRSRLILIIKDQEKIISTSNDEDEIEDAQRSKDSAERLLTLLPSIFPPESGNTEATIIFHDDFHQSNILVDDSGKITGVVDWECVSAMPLWKACAIPQLLKERPQARDEEPNRELYGQDAPDTINLDDKDALDNEGISIIYWEHLLEYELTVLRKLFLEEMGKRCPLWIQYHEESREKADFEEQVLNCDGLWRGGVTLWLNGREKARCEG